MAEKRIRDNVSNPMDSHRLAAVFRLMERRGRCDLVAGFKVEEAKEEVEGKNTSEEISAGDVNEGDVDEAV